MRQLQPPPPQQRLPRPGPRGWRATTHVGSFIGGDSPPAARHRTVRTPGGASAIEITSLSGAPLSWCLRGWCNTRDDLYDFPEARVQLKSISSQQGVRWSCCPATFAFPRLCNGLPSPGERRKGWQLHLHVSGGCCRVVYDPRAGRERGASRAMRSPGGGSGARGDGLGAGRRGGAGHWRAAAAGRCAPGRVPWRWNGGAPRLLPARFLFWGIRVKVR
jgi:hypothetical protein